MALNPIEQTQLLYAQQPRPTTAAEQKVPQLPSHQRMPVPGDPRNAQAVLGWQQPRLQQGPYGDGGFAPPQAPPVAMRQPAPATARMVGPQSEGAVEAQLPGVGIGKFQQFNPHPTPLDRAVNPDALASLASSLQPAAYSNGGTPIGLPLPPERTDGPSFAEQLADKGMPHPGSEAWRTLMGASGLQALQQPEQMATGRRVGRGPHARRPR